VGWDRKKKGPATGYYYRSVRTAIGVKKVYLGRGAAGYEAAEVERRKAARQAATAIIAADREATAEADRLAAELTAWAVCLSTLWLVLSGHHLYHGCWRKSRG
jgi:hypothetical protein